MGSWARRAKLRSPGTQLLDLSLEAAGTIDRALTEVGLDTDPPTLAVRLQAA